MPRARSRSSASSRGRRTTGRTGELTAHLPSDLAPYRRRLRESFGFPELRDGQGEVLEALASEDVLAVMPTGSGKSLCYVLPALEVGRTLVVSPLIALMQDQVESLNAAGVAATFINSNVPRDQRNARYADFIEGRAPLLYLSPEGLGNQRLVRGLRRHGVHLLAIDEAHCISQWGHDFRPDYLVLGELREQLGSPRTLALTATADARVRQDVLQRLGIAGARTVLRSFDRPNLRLSVVPLADAREREQWVRRYAVEHRGQAGIIYARTRRAVDGLAEALRAAGVPAQAYHAGLDRETRTRVQRRFTVDEGVVIVATVAFGMGIDRPDVRYILHVNLPESIEAYYQQAGRAGRDGEPAECVLLYARRDRAAQQRFIDQAHPDRESVREAWRRWVEQEPDGDGTVPVPAIDEDSFANVVAALRDSGLLAQTELRPLSLDPDAPIEMRSIEQHRRYAEGRLAQMTEYAETAQCRRAVILRYFGEQAADRCDNCDNCLGTAERAGPSYPADLHASLVALRDAIAERAGRPAHEIFELRTVDELATYRPRTEDELVATWGIAQTRADWFGAELLKAIADWERAHPDAERPARPPATRQRSAAAADAFADVSSDDPLFERLRAWRLAQARDDGVPAYTIFTDRTLRELVARRPASTADLLTVWGMGEARVGRFGAELLDAIREGEA